MTETKEDLINRDRLWRQVYCRNRVHDLVTYKTNDPDPRCPVCDNCMITEVKSRLDSQIVENDKLVR